MSFEKTWSGDWHRRILERVRELGFESVTQYASARVGTSLLVLAEELGPDDIAAAQLESILVEEATSAHAIPYALRDLLVRRLRAALPEGWEYPLNEESRFKVAGALAAWGAEHKDRFEGNSRFAAGQDLLNADLPTGWLPEGPDDPVVIAFVDRCLGRIPS